MDNIALLSSKDRKELFRQTAVKMSMLSEAAVEKDFWVCWVLNRLFESSLKDIIIFKGGTSLSKVFHVIHRFSEDIDLILNWKDNSAGDPMLPRGYTQQGKFNEKLDEWSNQFIRNSILPEVQRICGGICSAELSPELPDNIIITYPKAFSDPYLRPQILLEIGAKAAWVPHDTYEISSYTAEYYPRLFKVPKFKIVATTAERSFWEKVTILHSEAHRPKGNLIPQRYSRHYYDTVMMARSPIKALAFKDLMLLQQVAEFKDKFYHRGWTHYLEAKPGSLKLLPPAHNLDVLRDDYQKMQPMIYKDKLSFDEILDDLSVLEKEINVLR